VTNITHTEVRKMIYPPLDNKSMFLTDSQFEESKWGNNNPPQSHQNGLLIVGSNNQGLTQGAGLIGNNLDNSLMKGGR
jgi:hypothetical protein